MLGLMMALLRNILLAGSESRWLREQALRHRFMRRAVSRFMPGERPEEALSAVQELQKQSIAAVLTHLGEKVTDQKEAERVTEHYQDLLEKIRLLSLPAELSIKLTQLGLDLGEELCYVRLEEIIRHSGEGNYVWIDMEESCYVDRTLTLFRRARARSPNVGVCLQAYLYRTAEDLRTLLPLGPAIRLVKGAYREPPDRAYPYKAAVDENYFKLAEELLSPEARAAGVRAAFATHDRKLIRRIAALAESRHGGRDSIEFQMLYGIHRAEQLRLAREGWRERVLISYGSYWFPWFMRRLAERPANVFFVLRNLV
ncbi:MAG: proline dehydrogenase family protein [Terriglobia bacterium]